MNTTGYGEKRNQELQPSDARSVSIWRYGICVEAGKSKVASSLTWLVIYTFILYNLYVYMCIYI